MPALAAQVEDMHVRNDMRQTDKSLDLPWPLIRSLVGWFSLL